MTSLYPPLSPEEIAQRLETIAQEDWVKPLLNTKPNFWRIIEYGKNSYEIRQSRMIGWLLDTHQNHGIGDIFVKELIKIYAEDTAQLSNAQEFLFEKNFSTEVEFEVAITNSRDEKGRLDIQVVDSHNKLLIAIENKMYSSEHNAGKSDASQLQVYKEFFDKKIKNPESGYEGYTPLYIYLAPAGSETKTEGWVNISHEQLSEVYESILNLPDISPETHKILSDFQVDLTRQLNPDLQKRVGELIFENY